MITNKDLEIQNISYTNKDFGQIYPELLDLVKNITNKWDPEATNESDPGIVLLKALALVADKLNYNIDKNTLEQFITSATQETSVRRLTEMLGYNIGYYKSATSSISFRYLGELNKQQEDESSSLDITNLSNFCIKAFDTKLETDDGIIYTLLEDINIDSNNKLATNKKVIQGEIKTLNILGNDNNSSSNLIQLYNLDDQNRLYFPDIEVAENGVFINKDVYFLGASDYAKWHRVDNLNDQDLGSKVYKFGYDSNKGFPYIEFPKDIADLIGDGLQVYYISSSGVNGKISNGKLTKLSSVKITNGSSSDEALSINIPDDSYAISNATSSEGKNPESIDEAYINFKKTIGTFNTLVSCRDYSNYLNKYEDENGNRLVSQVEATDIRTDPDYSDKIFTRDSGGTSYYDTNIVKKDGFYDLILHGTTPVNSELTSSTSYDRTYGNLSAINIVNINNILNDTKCVSHNIKTPADGDINFIEADYTLKSNISTRYKVNTSEQNDIIKNIKRALYNNFNASKLDFGEEIPYDSIVSCIEAADTRIKNVNLMDPIVRYYIRKQGSNTKELYQPIVDNKLSPIISKNILAGSLPVYVDEQKLNYDYLQKSNEQYNNLVGIYCEKIINKDTYNLINNNESVQLLKDSFKTSCIYPTGVNYAFSNGSTSQSIVIKKNQIYELEENDILYLEYTDSDGVDKFVTYEKGSTIKPTFDIVNTNGMSIINDKIGSETPDVSNKSASKFVDWKNRKIIKDKELTAKSYPTYEGHENITALFGIGTSEEIDIVSKNEVTINKNNNIFWYIKPRVIKNGSLFNIENEKGSLILHKNPYNSNEYYYILEEGEYFIYPNDDATSLNILESGTKIVCKKIDSDTTDTIIIDKLRNNSLAIESMLEDTLEDEDIGTFSKAFNWENINRDLTVRESVISNFIDGVVISDVPLNSNWNKCSSLKIELVEYIVDSFKNIEEPLVRSCLSIQSNTQDTQQCLKDQVITLVYSDIDKETETKKATLSTKTLSTNEFIQLYPKLDTYNNLGVLQSIQYDVSDGEVKVLIDSDGNYLHNYYYSSRCYQNITNTPDDNTVDLLIYDLRNKNKLVINSRDEYVIDASNIEDKFTKLIIKPIAPNLYYSVFNSLEKTTSLYKSNSNLDDIVIANESNIFKLKQSGNIIYISKPKELSLCNYLLKLGLDNVEDIIRESLNDNSFDWLGERNNSKLISAYDPLYSFFDPNNEYNKLTLGKIDFSSDSSEFNIVGSSKL